MKEIVGSAAALRVLCRDCPAEFCSKIGEGREYTYLSATSKTRGRIESDRETAQLEPSTHAAAREMCHSHFPCDFPRTDRAKVFLGGLGRGRRWEEG